MDTVERVYQLAGQHNITLAELCKTCNINHSTIRSAKSRNGQLSVDTIEMICEGLGIPLSEFFKDHV